MNKITKTRIIIYLAVISFGLFGGAEIAGAAVVTGVTGTMSNGSSITITGSGFGSNGPNIVVFDDFEGGTNGSNIKTGAGSATIGKWDKIGGGDGFCMPKYDNIYTLSGSRAYKADYTIQSGTGGADASCMASVGNLNTGYAFVSYWVYLPTTSSFPCSGGICDWKLAWLMGANSEDDDQVIPNGQGGTTAAFAEWQMFGNDTYSNAWPENYFNFDMKKGRWYRIWVYIHATNVATGAKELWVMSTGASMPVTKKINISNYRIFKDIDSQFEQFTISAWARWCNGCAESAPRYDDVYLATGPNARARVEIGNSATYSSSTNLAIATVTSWNDTSITTTLRQGSFTSGQQAYLFVFDSNGVVNASGFPITVGGTPAPDTTPPSAPTGLVVN